MHHQYILEFEIHLRGELYDCSIGNDVADALCPGRRCDHDRGYGSEGEVNVDEAKYPSRGVVGELRSTRSRFDHLDLHQHFPWCLSVIEGFKGQRVEHEQAKIQHLDNLSIWAVSHDYGGHCLQTD